MKTSKEAEEVFAVVEVWRGVISELHVFHRFEEAQELFDELSLDHNENENDLQLISTILE